MARHDIAALVAARMQQAREELGLTLRDAAHLLKFENYQVLSSIEKGRRGVKTAELVEFARVYHRDLSFFLSTARPAPAPAVRWRSRAESSATKLAEQRFRQFLSGYALLEKLSGHEVSTFSLGTDHQVSGWEDAVALGLETHRRMELCNRPALELRTVLEEKFGVKLLVAMLPGAGSAASAMDDFGAGILVNAMDAPWRISFDLAHELYHLLTWDQDASEGPARPKGAKSPPEQYADKFASALLLPESSVGPEFRRRLKDGRIPYLDCVEMARAFGVSTAALLWRLVALGSLKPGVVTKALADENLKQADRAARKADWAGRPGTGPSRRYVSVAFECLKKGLVSRGRFAELMGIRRAEIAGFLAEFGYDESEDYIGAISTS
ncbi:MAG: XRE family transcriptional regulator [candidate division WOR-3 bacterium]|nr:XRE family transcriptional regulator [candidate division WOR-3 bacterium]